MKGLQYPNVNSKKNSSELAAQANIKFRDPPDFVPKPPFDLSGLPGVPLFIVLRQLNLYRLGQMRRTCRWVNQFISSNRRRLFWKSFHKVVVQQLKKAFETTYELSVYPEMERRDPYIICFSTKNTRPSTSFFAWLTETLSNTYIENWELRQFCYDEELLEGVEQTMVKKELRITNIVIGSIRSGPDPNSFLRFLTTFSPMDVTINQFSNEEHRLHVLFTDSFFKYMASLRKIYICNGTTGHPKYPFPDYIQRIPVTFHTYGVFIVPLSTVMKAIRTWYNCELEILTWLVALRQDAGSSVEQIGKSTGLPFHRFIQNNHEMIQMKNRRGKMIQIDFFFEETANSDITNLRIRDVPYSHDAYD